jgi:hypothetical protein
MQVERSVSFSMNPKRRRKEKRARKRQRQAEEFEKRFSSVLADLIAKLPVEQPPGKNYFLLSIGQLNDPADLTWNRNAIAIGTWDQIRNAVPLALSQLLPIRGELRFTVIQGQENIEAKLAEIAEEETRYALEKQSIPYN